MKQAILRRTCLSQVWSLIIFLLRRGLECDIWTNFIFHVYEQGHVEDECQNFSLKKSLQELIITPCKVQYSTSHDLNSFLKFPRIQKMRYVHTFRFSILTCWARSEASLALGRENKGECFAPLFGSIWRFWDYRDLNLILELPVCNPVRRRCEALFVILVDAF